MKNFARSLSFMTLETKPGCNVNQTFPFCHPMAAIFNVKKTESKTSEALVPSCACDSLRVEVNSINWPAATVTPQQVGLNPRNRMIF